MTISVSHNLPQLKAALAQCASQVPFAVANAINKTSETAKTEVEAEISKVFDRPTQWVRNSLRITYAKKTDLVGYLGFKDKSSTDWQGIAARSMLFPNVEGGTRRFKMVETWLMSHGMLPPGYKVVPGAGAEIDSYGNMNRSQITQIITVLNSWKPSKKTKGSGRGNKYSFEFWVNRVGEQSAPNLKPGVYQTVKTAFGSGVRPILIFTKNVRYKTRLDFHGIVSKVHTRDFARNFDAAFQDAMRTAIIKP